MIENDGIAEFPEAKAEEQSERERIRFRGGDIAFRFHSSSIVPLTRTKATGKMKVVKRDALKR